MPSLPGSALGRRHLEIGEPGLHDRPLQVVIAVDTHGVGIHLPAVNDAGHGWNLGEHRFAQLGQAERRAERLLTHALPESVSSQNRTWDKNVRRFPRTGR